MSEKRFVQLGDTSIKDTLTGEEWYAPCEISLLELLNEQQATISALKEENIELKKLKKYCAEWIGVNEDNLYDVVR